MLTTRFKLPHDAGACADRRLHWSHVGLWSPPPAPVVDRRLWKGILWGLILAALVWAAIWEVMR